MALYESNLIEDHSVISDSKCATVQTGTIGSTIASVDITKGGRYKIIYGGTTNAASQDGRIALRMHGMILVDEPINTYSTDSKFTYYEALSDFDSGDRVSVVSATPPLSQSSVWYKVFLILIRLDEKQT